MKKRFLYLTLACIALSSCRKDVVGEIPEISIETQNTYDDQAALSFMQTHALDAKGNLKDYIATDTTSVKLSDMNPVTLPSGVIYIKRANAQPDPGTVIGSSDILKLMSITNSYVATSTDGKVAYVSGYPFRNTIDGTGVPELDPAYYYVKKAVLDAGTYDAAKQRSFYEIEGFREGLKYFKAFDQSDDTNYNLQGIIIVPSRAAFARDPYFNYSGGLGYRNRSFVFNFQVYKTTAAPDPR